MSGTGWMLATLLLCAEPTSPSIVRIEPDAARGQSAAVQVNRGALVHTRQLYPLGPMSGPTPPDEQVRDIFGQLRDLLISVGSKPSQVVKLNVYVRHPSVTAHVVAELKSRFLEKDLPAVSYAQTVLPDESVMVALDAVAVLDRPDAAPISALGNPAAISILPEGRVAYISGQAERGDGSLADATRQTMKSLFATLEYLGASRDDVVQVKAFLTPMADQSAAIEEVIESFEPEACPPIVALEWDSTLPIEIELIVRLDAAQQAEVSALPIEFLTPPGMSASPVFSRVTRVNVPQRLYVSGLSGEQAAPSTPAEVREVFERLKRIVTTGNSDLRHLAKATYLVTNEDVSRALNEVRPDYYDPQRPPAASKALIAGTGLPPWTFSLDMIAVPLK